VTASDTPHLISYNGIEFDIPFLSIRAKKYGLDFVFPPHIDIFHNLNGRLKWQKLDSWCEFYGIPVGSNLKGIDVIDTYSTGDWAKAEKHVTDDVHKTWNIWEKVKEFVIW
jgi:DNA polymerase elongation subunit (family B)